MANLLTGLFADDEPITRLVSMRKKKDGTFEPYDVRIDRGSIWGNPYSHLPNTKAKWQVNSREEAIEKYRDYILEQPDLLAQLDTLRGKTLACWCVPLACHGNVLIEFIHNGYQKIER